LTGRQSKKDIFLDITKKYLPDNYEVLKNYDEASVDFIAVGDSLQDYFWKYPTVIHEAFHVFGWTLNSNTPTDPYFRYRINDSLTITTWKFNSIPARQIDAFVPKRDKTKLFAYDTYINSSDTSHVTQQFGFIGLLEEFVASYQSLKAYNALYYFLEHTYDWNKPMVWIKYLSHGGSDIYATNQFRLFISWYLQYCKKYKPEVFHQIANDSGIKRLYTFIEKQSASLIKSFLNNRNIVLEQIKPLTVRDDIYISLKTDLSAGYGIDDHIINLAITDSMLREPQHNILNVLRQ
jgi:hypothetical protein